MPPNAENEWAPPSSKMEPTNENSQSSGLDTLARFLNRFVDQSNNAIFYIVFIAGALGIAVGAAANWLRHRRKRTPI